MMMKPKSNPWARMKYAYVLPLAALTMTAFARPEVSEVTKEISGAKVSNLVENLQANRTQINAKDSIYRVVDVMPEFPGGVQAMMEFMKNNLRYPEELRAKGTQGRVVVQFVVNKDGSFSDMEVIRKVDPLMDAEALRVINAMPRWKPGMQDGKPVAVKYTVPVLFKLDQKGSSSNASKGDAGAAEGKSDSTMVGVDAKKALIFVDGKETDLKDVNSDDIASVSVVKAKKAVEIYGEKGKNGVLLIHTKSGSHDADVKGQGMVID